MEVAEALVGLAVEVAAGLAVEVAAGLAVVAAQFQTLTQTKSTSYKPAFSIRQSHNLDQAVGALAGLIRTSTTQ